MSRSERAFLDGFEREAQLAKQMLASPPSFTTPGDYMESVAHLHADSDDLTCRGLVVGCLSAVGKP
jgi:hypothetical protein